MEKEETEFEIFWNLVIQYPSSDICLLSSVI
jgi:hypothetical protein